MMREVKEKLRTIRTEDERKLWRNENKVFYVRSNFGERIGMLA